MNTPAREDVILKNNDLEYLVIQLNTPVVDICMCDHVNVLMHTRDHQTYIIKSSQYCLLDFLQDFPLYIEQVLTHERDVDAEYAENLGLRAAQAAFLYESGIDVQTNGALVDRLWICSATFNGTTDYVWLYSCKGRIFLEVTPRDPQVHRVLARFELSQSTLRAWHDQVSRLYQQALANDMANHVCGRREGHERLAMSLDACRYHTV